MADLARLDELAQFRQARALTDDELREEARLHTDLGNRAAAVQCLRAIDQAAYAVDPRERVAELQRRLAEERLSPAGGVELASLLRQLGREEEAEQVAAWASTEYDLQANLFAPAIEADRIEAELREQLPWWQRDAAPMLLFVVGMGVVVLVLWFASLHVEAHL